MQQIAIPEHFNKSAIARKLYPKLSDAVAAAKFHNKLNGECRMRFSELELQKIKEIIK